jgi:hypothetical protein
VRLCIANQTGGGAPSRREAIFGALGAALGVGATTAYFKGEQQLGPQLAGLSLLAATSGQGRCRSMAQLAGLLQQQLRPQLAGTWRWQLHWPRPMQRSQRQTTGTACRRSCEGAACSKHAAAQQFVVLLLQLAGQLSLLSCTHCSLLWLAARCAPLFPPCCVHCSAVPSCMVLRCSAIP